MSMMASEFAIVELSGAAFTDPKVFIDAVTTSKRVVAVHQEMRLRATPLAAFTKRKKMGMSTDAPATDDTSEARHTISLPSEKEKTHQAHQAHHPFDLEAPSDESDEDDESALAPDNVSG